jgi:hypothetical protein
LHLPENQEARAQAIDLHQVRLSMHAALRELDPLLACAEGFQQPGSLVRAHLSYCEPLLHQGKFHDAVPRLNRAMALSTGVELSGKGRR